jgi:UDP-N-acetylmuramoyl-L-alanyl-D-glutamate--2,6-diaminopimelate ligase
LKKEQIEQGIEALTDVEGRMTVIDEGQKFNVLVDFASTPDAFRAIIRKC